MSFEFIVTVKGIHQMRGDLTQATAFLVNRYGSLDEGIDAGARILPEWLLNPPELVLQSRSPTRTATPQHP